MRFCSTRPSQSSLLSSRLRSMDCCSIKFVTLFASDRPIRNSIDM